MHTVIEHIPISDQLLLKIKEEYKSDEEMCNLKDMIQHGWPKTKHEVPNTLSPYWNVRDELTIGDELILKGVNIVIPKNMRAESLKKIHAGHLGIVLCKRRARDLIYWPNINSQIEDMISNCSTCQEYQGRNQKESMISPKVPTRPWQLLASDLFAWDDKDYIIVVDYFSHYFETVELKSTTASSVINSLKSILACHGQCDEMITDNGPQYTSKKFEECAMDWNFKHTRSSPYYQSNGLAEKYVGIAKAFLRQIKTNKMFTNNYSHTDQHLVIIYPLLDSYSWVEG